MRYSLINSYKSVDTMSTLQYEWGDPVQLASKGDIPRPLRERVGHRHLACRARGEMMEAYCLKCREKREMNDATAITMKNGRPATQGVCPVCGTKMFKIGKTQTA